jgi:hypothetical protein
MWLEKLEKSKAKSTQSLVAASSLPLIRFSLLFSLTVESVPFHLFPSLFHRNHHHQLSASATQHLVDFGCYSLLDAVAVGGFPFIFITEKRVK